MCLNNSSVVPFRFPCWDGRLSKQSALRNSTDRRRLVKARSLQRLFPINSREGGSGLPAVRVEYLRAPSVARAFSRVIPIGRAADASGREQVAEKVGAR